MNREFGAASTAYFGGRSECRIRGVPLPVRYVDFTSMYPTVFALQDLWRWVVADHYEVTTVTAEAQRLLHRRLVRRSVDSTLWGRHQGHPTREPAGLAAVLDSVPRRRARAVFQLPEGLLA